MFKSKSNAKGLSTKEAESRLVEYGENILHNKTKKKPIALFFSQFKDLMTIILLISTALSVMMGDFTEALTIIAIVFLNAVLGFAQEYKTEKTLEALKKLAAPVCRVLRDGEAVTIEASRLVPGDVVFLEAGDKVPADSRIMEAVALEADESVLTGESVPVSKSADPGSEAEHFKTDRLYMGTIVTKGRATAMIEHTGMKTEMGAIASMLGEIEEEPTPLQKRLGQLGKTIGIGCLLICAVVSLTGILRGENVLDMLITGISLSVAAIPEGLPAIVTIALALAVGRMLKRKALIRKLHAVETLGCADVICSDKTGTLTQNKMTVKRVFTFGQTIDFDDKDSAAKADFRHPDLERLLEIGAVCNNSSVTIDEEDYKNRLSRNRAVLTVPKIIRAAGDPTETALLELTATSGKRPDDVLTRFRRYDEIPFDSQRKCMSVCVSRGGENLMFTKGAADVIVEKCSFVLHNGRVLMMTPALKRTILQTNDAFAADAMRVLGLAFRELSRQGDKAEEKLVFAGLTGMIDPPRPEAFEAVQKCRRAGIRPVMITGDHKVTAMAIAGQLGIYRPSHTVLTGREMDGMTDAEFEKSVENVSVFARVNPSHKLKIVKALKKKGHVVAMTGDGVNDAPAIKEASIGVSMGITGTDVTKEASAVILMDDNFATLVSAVEEGRVIYQNIRKFIRYLLSCNIGEVLTMFIGMLIGMPVVLLPIQILLINLATDGLPAIALGLETGDEGIMLEKPRKPEDGIFSGGLLFKILIRGCLIGLTTLGVFVSILKSAGDIQTARSAAFLTLVLTQLIHVFECKSETKSLFGINPFDNMKLLLAALLSAVIIFSVIFVPPLQIIFKTVALTPKQVLTVLGYCMVAPVISAVFSGEKKRERRQRKRALQSR